jgi:hypothetical protein
MNEYWECHVCGKEAEFELLPSGYLGNYHPLCSNCADDILNNPNHKHRSRLTYHKDYGDIEFVKNIIVPKNHFNLN